MSKKHFDVYKILEMLLILILFAEDNIVVDAPGDEVESDGDSGDDGDKDMKCLGVK